MIEKRRLPFFYGWVVVAVAFVTMGIGVNTRTAFSLLFPPILAEFGWDRAVTAGAFSVGFLVATAYVPFLGMAMDRYGPRVMIPIGIGITSLGLALAPLTSRPWHLHVTLGALVGGGSIFMTYIGHSLFLPHWFVRRRGLAIGVAFSGVGIGSIVLFPWLGRLIAASGWRAACWALVILLVVVLLPLNLTLPRRRPEDVGLAADGDAVPGGTGRVSADNVVDRAWTSVDWTLGRAMRTARFWWLFVGFFAALAAWYMVQAHQTKYLLDVGFDRERAALALGVVGLAGIVGQIALGWLSDRVGREWAWTLGGLGFAVCYATLLLLPAHPSAGLDLPGPPLRNHLRDAEPRRQCRRRVRTVGGGRDLRPHGNVHAGVAARDRRLRALDRRHLAGGAAPGARGGRARQIRRRGGALIAGTPLVVSSRRGP